MIYLYPCPLPRHPRDPQQSPWLLSWRLGESGPSGPGSKRSGSRHAQRGPSLRAHHGIPPYGRGCTARSRCCAVLRLPVCISACRARCTRCARAPCLATSCRAVPPPQVQRFVHLCRSSGGSWRYRWNEQGVFAMVWQIFVPEQQFVRLDFLYRWGLQPCVCVQARCHHRHCANT